MTSITDNAVKIQTTSEFTPSTPAWFGEVVLISRNLQKHGVFSKITEQVRFARKRFGRYDVIDFFAVLFGYAISGERTLEEFYERLRPFAIPFMAWFERDRLPSRSALSRFLAALTETPRQVSVLLHPLVVGPAPLLWRDWSQREHRRACMKLVQHQRIEVSLPPPVTASPRTAEVILSRAVSALSPLVGRAART